MKTQQQNSAVTSNEALSVISKFLSRDQARVLSHGAKAGEEREFFEGKVHELHRTITTMPVTYGQDGLDDQAVVYLHYFRGGCDWYITEKDIDGGIQQAFGLADLHGYGGELGYINIGELTASGVELDFHWTPTTLAAIKRKSN